MHNKLMKLLTIVLSILISQTATATKTEDAMSTNLAHKTNPNLLDNLGNKFILGFEGTTIKDEGVQRIAKQLRDGDVGGVILFTYNIVSPEQTKQLITDLKAAAGRKIWVAVDQEGGRVQRLRGNGFKDYKSPLVVAREMTPEQAYEHYFEMATELSQLGFNVNFGCVLDLHAEKEGDEPACKVIGALDRSFSSDAGKITTYATAFVKAHRDAGVMPCLKHYPGHGLSKGDSHEGLVDITKTRLDRERDPFRRMIDTGMADMIMTAHLVDQNADKHDPLSLSAVLPQWLREQDKFKGLVITDDLHMGAIGDHYSLPNAVLKALKAGSDLIIISNNPKAAAGSAKFQYLNDPRALVQQVAALVE